MLQLSFDDSLAAVCLGACIADDIPLAVEAGDEHRSTVSFASGLIQRDDRRLFPLGRRVSEAFTETAPAKLLGTAKILQGVICIEWGNREPLTSRDVKWTFD